MYSHICNYIFCVCGGGVIVYTHTGVHTDTSNSSLTPKEFILISPRTAVTPVMIVRNSALILSVFTCAILKYTPNSFRTANVHSPCANLLTKILYLCTDLLICLRLCSQITIFQSDFCEFSPYPLQCGHIIRL